MPDFRPHWLLKNAHLQTVVGILKPRPSDPYHATPHRVTLDDGDSLVIHEDLPPDGQGRGEVVVLIHGLTGCHDSSYMRRIAGRLLDKGYTVFRVDLRGCGDGIELAERPVHCGRGADVAAVLEKIAQLHPDKPAYAVGFSLGGALILNMLADWGHAVCGNLARALAICPPLDLVYTERHLSQGIARRYDRFFVRSIWKQVLRRWSLLPHTAPTEIPRHPRRLRELDEIVIVPSGGYASADDYYTKASPGPRLAEIRQPVTILKSQDDPIVPFQAGMRFHSTDAVDVVAPVGGGHLGFMSDGSGDPDGRWIDWRILDWLDAE